MKDNKAHTINFRLTENEYIEMEKKMLLSGYKSRSKFIRFAIFNKKIEIDRSNVTNTTPRNIDKMIILHAYEIKKIGVNYNQFVKAVNQRKQDIAIKGVAYYTKQLLGETIKLIKAYNEYVQELKKLNE